MAGDKNGGEGSITTSDGTVMSKGDIEFLMTCIQHTTGGQLLIDQAGVAAALDMKNVKSVGNRVSLMKKRYGLPLGTSSGKASGAAGASSPSVPKTTVKAIKKTPTPKKKVATSAKQLEASRGKGKVKKEETDDEGDTEQEVEQDVSSAEEDAADDGDAEEA